ncbi:MAG: hypothetical protein B7Z08_03795 [Sphingomonadales bacterium 32-68-7]|nr:MAG: hypothetical protein B7Z33_02230 [Sphingomonadales bacterium 12-68-11]OYX09807.1 MAG: hypothetical protein B7Z08_03795 [Sphingomonadales bacterium 32-68-7]
MIRLLLLAAAPLAIAASVPAAAQDAGGDKVNTIIVYGEDPCPQSTPDTINVCARLKESERYRIPQNLRESSDPANESWTNRVQAFETVGDFGPLSCTPYGAGGDLGCTAKMIETAYAARARSSDVRFGQLIEEARADRLAGIDAEAADTQQRVEELERQYMERLRREAEAEGDPLPAAPAAAPAERVDPSRLAEPPSGN